MKWTTFAGAVAVACISMAGGAYAANVTINETINLAVAENPSTSPGWFGWRDFTGAGGAFSPDFSYTLSAGDTLNFTAMFASGQSLTLTHPQMFWLFSYITDGPQSSVNSTGNLTLFDTMGNPIYTSIVKTDDEGSVHFGQYFYAADFASLPNVLTIGGLEYDGTLNSYDDSTVTIRTYGDPQVVFDASGVTIAGIPEASTWALLGLGFAGLGFAGYRRTRSSLAIG